MKSLVYARREDSHEIALFCGRASGRWAMWRSAHCGVDITFASAFREYLGGPVSDCSGLHIRFDNRAAVACSLNPTEIRPSVVTPVFATTRVKRGMKTIAASSWQSSRRHSSVHGERSCVRQANY